VTKNTLIILTVITEYNVEIHWKDVKDMWHPCFLFYLSVTWQERGVEAHEEQIRDVMVKLWHSADIWR